jgi:hypothetical protein
MNKYIIFVLRVEIHLFGMPNICEECPNSMNSYVHGLAGVRDFVFVPYVLNGQPLTAANRHFWIFDVSTWSHGGIVGIHHPSTFLQQLRVIFDRSDIGDSF